MVKSSLELAVRSGLIRFLAGHPRNQTTYVYSLNAKIDPRIFLVKSVIDWIHERLRYWSKHYDFYWQSHLDRYNDEFVIVLAQGHLAPAQMVAQCDTCLRNQPTAGRCNDRNCPGATIFKQYRKQVVLKRDIDVDQPFDSWPTQVVQERVSFIKEFDKLGEDIVGHLKQLHRQYVIELLTTESPNPVYALRKR